LIKLTTTFYDDNDTLTITYKSNSSKTLGLLQLYMVSH